MAQGLPLSRNHSHITKSYPRKSPPTTHHESPPPPNESPQNPVSNWLEPTRRRSQSAEDGISAREKQIYIQHIRRIIAVAESKRWRRARGWFFADERRVGRRRRRWCVRARPRRQCKFQLFTNTHTWTPGGGWLREIYVYIRSPNQPYRIIPIKQRPPPPRSAAGCPRSCDEPKRQANLVYLEQGHCRSQGQSMESCRRPVHRTPERGVASEQGHR